MKALTQTTSFHWSHTASAVTLIPDAIEKQRANLGCTYIKRVIAPIELSHCQNPIALWAIHIYVFVTTRFDAVSTNPPPLGRGNIQATKIRPWSSGRRVCNKSRVGLISFKPGHMPRETPDFRRDLPREKIREDFAFVQAAQCVVQIDQGER